MPCVIAIFLQEYSVFRWVTQSHKTASRLQIIFLYILPKPQIVLSDHKCSKLMILFPVILRQNTHNPWKRISMVCKLITFPLPIQQIMEPTHSFIQSHCPSIIIPSTYVLFCPIFLETLTLLLFYPYIKLFFLMNPVLSKNLPKRVIGKLVNKHISNLFPLKYTFK